MPKFGIATGLAPGQPLSSLGTLLRRIADAGFTHAEIGSKSLGVAMNGHLNPVRLKALSEVLAGSPLSLTLHGTEIASARGGNLMDISTESQLMTVRADIMLAQAIGATVVVYHSGMLRDPGGDGYAVAAGIAAERRALTTMGDRAGESGITIAVENRDPVGRYVLRHAYGFDLERLAEHIEAIGHPHVGVCLDVGHAFLSHAWLGKEYLDGVRRIAPLTAHIHLSDNFGHVQLDETADPVENLIQGLGDLHLMPGWGAIPLDDVFAIEFPRDPVVLLELRPTFTEHLDLAAALTRRLAEKISPA